MASCAFFEHWKCPKEIKNKLQEVLEGLIISCDVNMFYVGNQGQFDSIGRCKFREMKEK